VVRVAEGGEILEEISTGDEGVSACMHGGDDGRKLYLCGAPHFDETERSSTRLGRPVGPTSTRRAPVRPQGGTRRDCREFGHVRSPSADGDTHTASTAHGHRQLP
jgi:hypothetical protein